MRKAAVAVLLFAYVGQGRRISAKDPEAFNPSGHGGRMPRGQPTRIASRPVMLDGSDWDPMSLGRIESRRTSLSPEARAEARIKGLLTALTRPRAKTTMSDEYQFLERKDEDEDLDYSPTAPPRTWIDEIELTPVVMFGIYAFAVGFVVFLQFLLGKVLDYITYLDRCDPEFECCNPPCAEIDPDELGNEPLWIPGGVGVNNDPSLNFLLPGSREAPR